MRGRPLTFGKFTTRKKLEDAVIGFLEVEGLSYNRAGKICGVSGETAKKIWLKLRMEDNG